MGHQAQDRPQEGQEDHPRNRAVVPAASAHGRYGAASGAVLEASRSLPVFRRALQHESHGSGTRSSVPCLALLAPPSQQQESNALGEVRGIVTAITVAVTQDHPRSLIVCGVTKLCVGIGVAILITEEPDDRIGHVRICGGDGSVMAVSTRNPSDLSTSPRSPLGSSHFPLLICGHRSCPRGNRSSRTSISRCWAWLPWKWVFGGDSRV